MALNEAAVQLLSSKILKNKAEVVKYYGIDFSTTSPSSSKSSLVNFFLTRECSTFSKTF